MKFRIVTASGTGIDTEREIYRLEQIIELSKEHPVKITFPSEIGVPTLTILDEE